MDAEQVRAKISELETEENAKVFSVDGADTSYVFVTSKRTRTSWRFPVTASSDAIRATLNSEFTK
jgi:hypothetical protein